MVGIATHLKMGNMTACGIVSPRYATLDTLKVDCVRCHRTHHHADARARRIRAERVKDSSKR